MTEYGLFKAMSFQKIILELHFLMHLYMHLQIFFCKFFALLSQTQPGGLLSKDWKFCTLQGGPLKFTDRYYYL